MRHIKRMFVGRTAELEYLNHYYKRDGSHLLVVYGQRYIGKTTLLHEFIKDKPCHYYMARACSEREHLFCFGNLVNKKDSPDRTQFSCFQEIFNRMMQGKDARKNILIIDEFQNLVKNSKRFMEELISFWQEYSGETDIFIILVSSHVSWVENRMVSQLGKAAHNISDVYKIKELEFYRMKEYFPKYTVKECMEVYSILGGIPGLWQYFDDSDTVRENVCRNILDAKGFLHYAAEHMVAEELRETSVYNTILTTLAMGKHKLNELYLHTGFSRAKISVYLKNLMEMEFVEKVFSFDLEGQSDTQKGTYRICSHYLNFYYTYLYLQEGKLFDLSAEEYYDTYISPDFERYMKEYFRKVCMQHFNACSRNGRLPFSYSRIGSWFGKRGTIDIIAKDEAGHTMIAFCRNCQEGMEYEDYRNFLVLMEKTKLKADQIRLYAAAFDERIIWEAKRRNDLVLTGIDEL